MSFAVITMSVAFGQADVPPYKQNKKLPVFEMETVGSGVYSTTKLKKNTPTLIMFFSPGCDHCIHQFEAMKKRMTELKKYQIVMATYQPIDELAEFNKKYEIQKYPNIITGRDANYFLPPFYQISNFPYLAFYDKSGMLITTFEGNMSVDDMLKKFK
jgi:thioredoxin-related protein